MTKLNIADERTAVTASGNDLASGQPAPALAHDGSVQATGTSILSDLRRITSEYVECLQTSLARLKLFNRSEAATLLEECERALAEINEHLKALDAR